MKALESRRTPIDPDDPVMLLAQISETVAKEAIEGVRSMLADQLDQISATHVQALEAARAAGDALVLKSAQWAAERIREAGEVASASLAADVSRELSAARARLERATWAVWFAAGIALCAAVGTLAVLWL